MCINVSDVDLSASETLMTDKLDVKEESVLCPLFCVSVMEV